MSNQHSGRPEDHEARNPNLDPDVTGDADLEPGGGVKPGHTPPDSQSATSTPPTYTRRPAASVEGRDHSLGRVSHPARADFRCLRNWHLGLVKERGFDLIGRGHGL